MVAFAVQRDDIDAFLSFMEYPCTADDLSREARRDGQPRHVIDMFRGLPPRSNYSGARDVRVTLHAEEEPDAVSRLWHASDRAMR